MWYHKRIPRFTKANNITFLLKSILIAPNDESMWVRHFVRHNVISRCLSKTAIWNSFHIRRLTRHKQKAGTKFLFLSFFNILLEKKYPLRFCWALSYWRFPFYNLSLALWNGIHFCCRFSISWFNYVLSQELSSSRALLFFFALFLRKIWLKISIEDNRSIFHTRRI